LHALESLSARLATLGRYAEAVEAALNAVDIEPLRESAHRALIQAPRVRAATPENPDDSDGSVTLAEPE